MKKEKENKRKTRDDREHRENVVRIFLVSYLCSRARGKEKVKVVPSKKNKQIKC
tara:strand:+ start:347 stop:508 length:162 start_codon:yes stop_codon:yes gene_type:complete